MRRCTVGFYENPAAARSIVDVNARNLQHESDYRNSSDWTESVRYWENKAQEPLPPLRLYGRASSNVDSATLRVAMELGVQRSDALRKVAAQLADASDDVSLTKVLVTALFAYLYRASGNEIVGMRVTLNDRMPESANGVVSGSARQCPVQVTVDAEDSFSTLYAKTSQELDTVGRHVQSAPSEWSDELNYAVSFDLDEIRAREFNGVPVTMRLSRSPLAGSAVRNHNPASSALAARPASANAPAVSQRDALGIHIVDYGGDEPLVLHLELRDDIFHQDLQAQAQQHLLRLLDALLHNQNELIENVAMVEEVERQTILASLTGPKNYSQNTSTLPERFRGWVMRDPDRQAVDDGQDHMSYAELNLRSLVMAQKLLEAGVISGDRVVVCISRSSDLLVAFLGTMHAGAVYVPVDPANPAKRNSAILQSSKATAVVVDEQTKRLASIDSAVQIVLSQGWQQSARPLEQATQRSTELSNIIYTSGSTGTPKGVATLHSGLANLLASMQRLLRFD